MDNQVFFNIALSLAGFFGGWVLNRLTQAVDRLDKDVRDMPHNYVSKEDYRVDIKEIKDMLGKIFDQLNNKVDK